MRASASVFSSRTRQVRELKRPNQPSSRCYLLQQLTPAAQDGTPMHVLGDWRLDSRDRWRPITDLGWRPVLHHTLPITFRVLGNGPGTLRVGADRRQVPSVGTLSHRGSHSRLTGSEPKHRSWVPRGTPSGPAPAARPRLPCCLPGPRVPSGVGHGRHPEAVAHRHIKRTGTACPHPPILRGMPAGRESRAAGSVPWLRTACDTAVPAVPGRR